MDSYKKFLLLGVFLVFELLSAKAQERGLNLDYFIRQAEKASPLVKDYHNQQLSASIDSLLIHARAKPQLTANSAGRYAPIIHGFGYDEVLTNGQALEALLTASYDLLNKKRMANELEGINIQQDSIRYASQLSVFDLHKSITDQYIATYADQQQVAFNHEVLSLLRQEDLLLKQLTRSNIYKQSEYLTFLVTLKQQELSLKQAELLLKNDYAMLNYLAGIPDTTVLALNKPELEAQYLPIDKSFFTRRFEIDSLKSLNQQKALALSYQPKLNIYANGGYNSSFILQPYKNWGSSVGFTFSVPLYDGHQKKMKRDKLYLTGLTSTTYKDFFLVQQRQQINLITQQIAVTDGMFKQIREQINFTKGLIDVNSKLLRTGDVKMADFILAINNYMAAQNLMRQTDINRLKLLNQLNYWNR